jgi:DNA ligase-1
LGLSPLLEFTDWDDLAALRADPPVGAAAEGLMLKRRDSLYVAGSPQGAVVQVEARSARH